MAITMEPFRAEAGGKCAALPHGGSAKIPPHPCKGRARRVHGTRAAYYGWRAHWQAARGSQALGSEPRIV